MLRELFRLPYRQTEGLGRALAKLLRAEIAIPDFTSLAKRAAKMSRSLDASAASGPLDVVVDSTGLKVYGEGEWKVRQHGVGKRRTWRKLHLAVDPDTHEIVAEVLTENNVHDADQVWPLLKQVDRPVRTFYGYASAYATAAHAKRRRRSTVTPNRTFITPGTENQSRSGRQRRMPSPGPCQLQWHISQWRASRDRVTPRPGLDSSRPVHISRQHRGGARGNGGGRECGSSWLGRTAVSRLARKHRLSARDASGLMRQTALRKWPDLDIGLRQSLVAGRCRAAIGPGASVLFDRQPASPGAACRSATELSDNQAFDLGLQWRASVEELLDREWKAVNAIRDELLKCGRLSGNRVRHLWLLHRS